jgi:ribosomal protein S18 acetylase RimI-like enzyme
MEATLRKFDPVDFDRLVKLYVGFEPKGAFQGLPPLTLPRLKSWLRELRLAGDEQFVIDIGGRIVGHSMLCRSEGKAEAEFAIFVHQDFRALGLGKKLLLGTLNYGCKQMQLDRVWLSVQGSNPVALCLFEGAGFKPVGSHEPLLWELEMERPSHCAKCKGERCILFGQSLPMTVPIPRRSASIA